MSLLTPFLKLFKWDTTNEIDLESEFNIDKSTNENWDKLDTKAQEHENKILDIENNIENIQTKDTEQDKLIQKLKDNCINVTTEEATSLHVTDASTVPAKLDIRGNQRQATREGYNLLKITKENQSYYGVTMTINKDKSVSFKGTSTSTTGGFALVGNTEFSVDDFPYGEQLTFSCKGLVDGVEFAIAESDINGSWLRNLVVLNSSSPTKQATVSKGENASYIRAAYTVTTGKTFSNVITYPMIYKGTEGKPFESYGASPSLDYPSEVEAVGDNVNIFDKDNMNKMLATPSGLTVIASSSGGASFYLEVKPNTDYTISRKIVGQRFLAATSVEVPAVGGTLTQNVPNNTGDGIHIKTGKNDKYLLVYYLYNNSENEEEILSSIKIEEGTEATSYSSYGQGSVEVRKLTENVIDLSKAIALYNTEITEIDKENGIIKVHRTNTQDPSIEINCNLPVGQYSLLHNSHNFGQISLKCGGTNEERVEDIGSEKYKTFYAEKGITKLVIYSGSELPTDYEINFSDIILVMGNVAREDIKYVKYQESSYILDIQQPMLSGDYFVKEADGWKEVHTWNKVVLTGNENSWSWNTDNLQRVSINVANGLNNQSRQMIYSNNFIYGASGNNVGIGFLYASRLYLYYPENITSLEDWKALLQEKYNSGNPVYVYYPLATPTKLACTEAQSNVLDQLNELELFKGTNNIYTEQDLALLQLDYTADTKMYIDNKIANLKEQVNTTNELLSTTGTSAMLLDNLQNDLESEVM